METENKWTQRTRRVDRLVVETENKWRQKKRTWRVDRLEVEPETENMEGRQRTRKETETENKQGRQVISGNRNKGGQTG